MKSPGRPVEKFMAEFATHLDGRGAWRRRVEAEMRDGLDSAIESVLVDDDSDTIEAERWVLRDWGSPRDLAEEFNGIGSVDRAGRLAGRMLIAIPVLAVGWALVVLLSRDPWPAEPLFVFVATRLLGASVAVSVVFSLMILMTRRRATLSRRPSSSSALGVFAGTASATLVLVAMLCYRAAAGPQAIHWDLVILPGLLTPVLLGLTGWDAVRIRAAALRRGRGGVPD